MSDLAAAESHKTLAALGITHVLSVMPGTVMLPKAGALKTLQIPIRDGPFEELAAHLASTTAFIGDGLHGRGTVLVHCVQGMSRSASVIAAYLMAVWGCSVRDAVEFVKSRSSTAQPNTGFMSQLQEYHDKLHQKAFR